MAGWICYDYRCDTCGITRDKLMKRDVVVDIIECKTPDCDGLAGRILSANICRVSYPDGTTDRWKYVKEKRALDKIKRLAKRSGDTAEVGRIVSEQGTILEHSKTDKQAVNICKVELKE